MVKENVILGISLGTRRLGMAIGTHKELIDWQIKVFPQTYSKKKVKKIWRTIENTIARYQVTTIGMKLPPQYSHSPGLAYYLTYITEQALKKDIPLVFYDIQTLENHYLNAKRKNKL